MSTYNGERYLNQQLDSILAQSVSEWQLFIRDDGSTDSTLDLLQKYANNHPKKIHIITDGENLGACKSFERLLQLHGNADYIAFADQDDVWLPDKIELSLRTIKQAEQQYPNLPIVVHTDLQVVDEHLNEISPSFWQYSNIRPSLLNDNLHYLAICNSVTGCTALLNHNVCLCSLPFSKNAYMHDAWIALQTKYNNGVIIPIFQSTIRYRQHNKNALGAIHYQFTLGNWRWKYSLAKQAYKQAHPHIFNNIVQFLFWKIRYFFALHS
jgi:glycosyltransferase involved in cell wall biosynthesis